MKSNWKTKTLSEVCTKIGSGQTPRGGKESYKGGRFALVRSQNVYNQGFTENGLVYINDSQADQLSNVEILSNDVFINITGDSVTRCCMVPEEILPARVNQHVAILRADNKVLDGGFLRYFLISPKIQRTLLSLSSGGATRKALTKSMLESFEIVLPTMLEQKAISNISYSKRWPKSKNSFSTNFYSNLDLLIDEKTNTESNYYIKPGRAGTQINIEKRTFPKFSFRHGQSNFFPTTANTKKWYNTITWNYGLNYTNTNRKYYESDSIQINDSISDFDWMRDNSGNLITNSEQKNGWVHTSRINAPQKLFKYISLNPSINLKSAWVNETNEGTWNGLSFDKTIKNGFASRTTGSFSINTNTQLYGLLAVPYGPIKAFRHVMSPSIGYSWTPDFSKPFFGKELGYVLTETISDTNSTSFGKEIFHDRFSGTMAGSTPRTERKSMTFGLNNIFQAKIKKGNEENKIDLFSWRMNSSYNFAADSMHLANLRSSARSKLLGKLNLDMSMTHDFYQYDKEKNRRIANFNKNQNGHIAPRLVNARLSTGFRMSGKPFSSENNNEELKIDSTNMEESFIEEELNHTSKHRNNTIGNNKSWNTNINLSYSYSATNPLKPKETFWANTTSTINFTSKWRVSYRARFDIMEKNLVSHSVSVYRDLHCWELSLNWTPNGLGQGINFRLNVKSNVLQDLKIEKKGGIYSGAGL